MREPAFPDDEQPRLTALRDTGLLDSAPEARFDRLTRLAQRYFSVPIALVSLVDSHRQWFKSRQGLDACETGRDISFCGHAILETEVFVVCDATKDPRFFDNPLVIGSPSIRFYAGAPLTTTSGYRIGTLCIIDQTPHPFDALQAAALREIADCVEEEINQIQQDLQRRSLATLARITGFADPDPRQQLRTALTEGCAFLGLPIGVVNRVTADGFEVVVAVSPGSDLADGTRIQRGESFCDLAAVASDVIAIAHVSDSVYRHTAADHRQSLECYLGAPLTIDGTVFGSISFASPASRPGNSFVDAELEFLRLLAHWVAKTLRQWQADEARRTAQEELRHAYELLEKSSEAARIGSWEFDLASRTPIWSRVTRDIHEVDSDYQPSLDAALAFFPAGPSREAISQAFQSALSDGEPFDLELEIITARGHERWVRVIGLPVMQEGRCARIYGLFQDVSERKRVERMKSEFISIVSHELRTPLTSINGALSLIESGALGELPSPVGDLLRVAKRNGLRLTHLINDLLDMDKLLAGKMQFDISEQRVMPLIDHAVESNQSYAASRQVTLTVTARDESATVAVDGSRLQQVLANLLSNASKYSPPSGQVQVRVLSAAQAVRIEVIDHGPGVPADFRERIFDKFSQADASDGRSRGGTGLGLAISKRLVEEMRGQIGFESTEGSGATFYVEFPRITRP